jgi:hypothetical protein
MSRDEDSKVHQVMDAFDVRIVKRNIKKGLTTPKDYEKHLKALPDVSDKICPPDDRSPELTGVGYVPEIDDRPDPRAALTAASEADDDDDAN